MEQPAFQASFATHDGVTTKKLHWWNYTNGNIEINNNLVKLLQKESRKKLELDLSYASIKIRPKLSKKVVVVFNRTATRKEVLLSYIILILLRV